MKLKKDPGAIFTLLVLLICLLGVFTARQWQFQARLFPWTIGIPAFLLCVIQLVLDIFRSKASDDPDDVRGLMDLPVDSSVPMLVVMQRAANIFGWILGFFAAIWIIGFIISVPLFIILYLGLQARERISLTLIYAGIMLLFLLVVFHYVLHIPWPAGVISAPEEWIFSVIGE
jgi:hypothetical protein